MNKIDINLAFTIREDLLTLIYVDGLVIITINRIYFTTLREFRYVFDLNR